MVKTKRKFQTLLCKKPVFKASFGQNFLRISAKFFYPRANDQSQHQWKYQYLVSMTYHWNPRHKIPILKLKYLVKSFLNKRSRKYLHATWNTLNKKMETISVKFLSNSDVCYLSTRSRKFCSGEENWHFWIWITLVSHWNRILVFSLMVALIICSPSM